MTEHYENFAQEVSGLIDTSNDEVIDEARQLAFEAMTLGRAEEPFTHYFSDTKSILQNPILSYEEAKLFNHVSENVWRRKDRGKDSYSIATYVATTINRGEKFISSRNSQADNRGIKIISAALVFGLTHEKEDISQAYEALILATTKE